MLAVVCYIIVVILVISLNTLIHLQRVKYNKQIHDLEYENSNLIYEISQLRKKK